MLHLNVPIIHLFQPSAYLRLIAHLTPGLTNVQHSRLLRCALSLIDDSWGRATSSTVLGPLSIRPVGIDFRFLEVLYPYMRVYTAVRHLLRARRGKNTHGCTGSISLVPFSPPTLVRAACSPSWPTASSTTTRSRLPRSLRRGGPACCSCCHVTPRELVTRQGTSHHVASHHVASHRASPSIYRGTS